MAEVINVEEVDWSDPETARRVALVVVKDAVAAHAAPEEEDRSPDPIAALSGAGWPEDAAYRLGADFQRALAEMTAAYIDAPSVPAQVAALVQAAQGGDVSASKELRVRREALLQAMQDGLLEKVRKGGIAALREEAQGVYDRVEGLMRTLEPAVVPQGLIKEMEKAVQVPPATDKKSYGSWAEVPE